MRRLSPSMPPRARTDPSGAPRTSSAAAPLGTLSSDEVLMKLGTGSGEALTHFEPKIPPLRVLDWAMPASPDSREERLNGLLGRAKFMHLLVRQASQGME